MTAGNLNIQSVRRKAIDGTIEELRFEPGVNLLCGPPNTGKTQWFRTIDFLLGDPESARNRFSSTILRNYEQFDADISLNGQTFAIQRLLRAPGFSSKVRVDGQWLGCYEFQKFLMAQLRIPQVRWPKGLSPISETSAELSFRMLLRHIHRQQRFWSSIADKQFEFEVAACILQFVGLADKVFSDVSDQLTRQRQEYDAAIGFQRQLARVFTSAQNVQTEKQEAEPASLRDVLAILGNQEKILESEIGKILRVIFDCLGNSDLDMSELSSKIRDLQHKSKEVGKLQERISLLNLAHRVVSDNISKITVLQTEINSRDFSREIEEGARLIAAGINDYIHRLNVNRPGTWRHNAVVGHRYRGKEVSFYVGHTRWDKALGGTDSILFLLGYHFALLKLSCLPDTNYPGYAMIDLPAALIEDGITQRETAVVEPFYELCRLEKYKGAQVIFAGNSFVGAEDVHSVRLHEPYVF